MPLKLLAVGDLHLGRQPTRLPEALARRGAAFGSVGAWEAVVDAAIRESVHALVLAGDVVEREHDFFEAYRHLRTGVERLAASGIRVLAVSGNHDGATLPRLAGEIEGFELLGRGGIWECAAIEAGTEAVSLWGWSFPSPQVTESPLRALAFERGPGPNVGLLHCDRDQPGSRYAPVSARELAAAPLDAWLLGHIHQPDALTAAKPSGYLGSVTGLDPGEPGARGPWLVVIEGGRIGRVEHWPLAPLRWERLSVDLDELTVAAEARTRLLDAVRRLDDDIQTAPWQPAAVGLRVRFGGRTRIGDAEIAELFPEDERAGLHESNGVQYFVDSVVVETLPEIPLAELAQRSDPPGLLARRLLILERPADDTERRALLRHAREHLEGAAREPRWQLASTAPPDDSAVADWLTRAARRALEHMLAESEVG